MNTQNDRSLYVLTVLVILLGILVAGVGLFWTTSGQPYEVTNIYGDTVRLYGDGLYAYDAYFFAPIFRGSDLTILFLAIPLLIAALVLDRQRKTIKTRLFLFSIMSILTYHAVSIAFCVVYNQLHLAYILLFSASIFAFILALVSLDTRELVRNAPQPFPYRGLYIFLGFTGVALIAAWFPDIIAAISAGRAPESLAIYTTSVTNVLDIGLIGPASLLSLFLMRKQIGMGYALAPMLLTLCTYVGIMVVSQTIFQVAAGIELPLPVLLTKAASFVVLALFALYFDVKFFRNLRTS